MDNINNNENRLQAAAAALNSENEEMPFSDAPLIPDTNWAVSDTLQGLREDAETSLIDSDCQQLAGILANQPEVRIENLELPAEKPRKKSATEKQLDMLGSVNAPGNRDTLAINRKRRTLTPLPQAKQKYENALAKLKQDLADFFEIYPLIKTYLKTGYPTQKTGM